LHVVAEDRLGVKQRGEGLEDGGELSAEILGNGARQLPVLAEAGEGDGGLDGERTLGGLPPRSSLAFPTGMRTPFLLSSQLPSPSRPSGLPNGAAKATKSFVSGEL
jgi:hypothetical protein